MLESVAIGYGEIRCWSLLGAEGKIKVKKK